MALIAWAIYDDAGVPLTGVVPVFVDYRDRTGAARTPPTIVELGAGQYGFDATTDDASTGTVFLVDNGSTANPRRVSGVVTTGALPFSAWHLEDDTGALWAGAAPTVGSYVGIGGALSSPGIVSVTAYLFSLTPETADATDGVTFRADSPSGAWPLYIQDTLLVAGGSAPASESISGIRPAAAAAKALREWLLTKLPSACIAVNLTRAAVLRSPRAGPYVFATGATLKVSITAKSGVTISIPMTVGSQTATQVAATINVAAPGMASVDSDDHLVLTSPTPPSYNTTTLAATNSVVAVGSDSTAANSAIGWDIAGEHAIATPIVPPGPKGVCDGMPLQGFFEPSQLGKGRVLVTIGERTFTPVDDNPRRFEWLVTLELGIFRAEPQQVVHQTREGIQAALQCVQECLMTDAGKRLGRAAFGDIQYGRIHDGRIAPFSFRAAGVDGKPAPGGILFDAVNCKYLVRVYQAPTL